MTKREHSAKIWLSKYWLRKAFNPEMFFHVVKGWLIWCHDWRTVQSKSISTPWSDLVFSLWRWIIPMCLQRIESSSSFKGWIIVTELFWGYLIFWGFCFWKTSKMTITLWRYYWRDLIRYHNMIFINAIYHDGNICHGTLTLNGTIPHTNDILSHS